VNEQKKPTKKLSVTEPPKHQQQSTQGNGVKRIELGGNKPFIPQKPKTLPQNANSNY